MLIPSARHRLDDLPLWKELAAGDLVHGNHKGVGKKAVRAMEAMALI